MVDGPPVLGDQLTTRVGPLADGKKTGALRSDVTDERHSPHKTELIYHNWNERNEVRQDAIRTYAEKV
jgi:hypothetical protein